MKNIFYLLLVLGFSACSSSKMFVNIPAQQTLELSYPNYEVFMASLKNKSTDDIEVAVLSKSSEKQIRGFGLAQGGKAEVMVESSSKLVLKNQSKVTAQIAIEVSEKDRSVFEQKGEYINFTLQNTTAKSIPLLIPSVMNPNLSPFSKSGVGLKIGQEILFRFQGKRYVLLTVDNSIAQNSTLNVAKLIKDRKQELGLE